MRVWSGLLLSIVVAACSGAAPATDGRPAGGGEISPTASATSPSGSAPNLVSTRTTAPDGSGATASPAATTGPAATAGTGADGPSRAVLADFDTDRLDGSLARLHARIMRDPDGVRTAAAELLAASDQDVRVGALYALYLTARPGPSLDALRPLLASGDSTERLIAAETLATRGEEDAIPILIEALGSTDPIRHWHPYREGWQRARRVLLRLTRQDLGLQDADDADSVAAARPAWLAWWQANAATFQIVVDR